MHKSILLAIALMFTSIVGVNAQDFAGRLKGPTTLTNAATDTASVTIPLSRSAITFKYDIAKTSGTVAGTIVLQYKLSTVTGEQWFTYNTYTLTDATLSTAVSLVNNPGLYWRVITTTTGTQVSVHNKYLLYRK